MPEINRSLLVVKPKQPYLDWVHTLIDERFTLDDVRDDSTAYLIPEVELIDERAVIIECCYDFIFEVELASWHPHQADWPEQRDLKTFLEWFDLEFHSLVLDMGRTPIEEIEYGPDEDMSSNGH